MMCTCSKYTVVSLLLFFPGSVQSAWVSHRTTARQQFSYHGSTIQRSTNPSLSGELLPQGIVDSRTVYRGGLIEKPKWNGAPASGFREAKSIQSMYYALSTLPETETEQEIPAPPFSSDKNRMPDQDEYLYENSQLDQVNTLSEGTGETTETDIAHVETGSTSVLERNGYSLVETDRLVEEEEEANVVDNPIKYENGERIEAKVEETFISVDADQFAEKEEGVAVDSIAEYENSERIESEGEESFISSSGDIIESLGGQMEETIVAEKDQEHSIFETEEAIAVLEENWDRATIVTTEETETDDAVLHDVSSQFASSNREEPLVTMENEDDTTATEIISAVEASYVENEAVEEAGAVFRQEGSVVALEENVIYEDANVAIADNASNEIELERMDELNIYEQAETDVDYKETFIEESATSSYNLQSVESSETNHVLSTQMIERPSIVQPRTPSKRIPLFQRMNLDESKESAFVRVVRRYDEANKRRLEMIRNRTRMTESINGLEDVEALNDLFGKLTSAGITSKAKMYGKRVVLNDGTTIMGKKRKLCIELEWEMD